MQFKIEDGIPVPGRLVSGAAPIYPFGEMLVNQSFAASKGAANKAHCAARVFKNRHPGWDYAFRRMEDGTARIWRTA